MSGDQLAEPHLDHLQAAIFEQRRLAHMLRRRADEIEAQRRERERLGGKLAALTAEHTRVQGELERAREEILAARDEASTARDEALKAREESVERLEASARRLGEARKDIELLVAREKERQVLVVDTDRALAEVAEHLRRTRASRSWRWGHSLARAVSFRGAGHRRSALDVALSRLEACVHGAPAQGETGRR